MSVNGEYNYLKGWCKGTELNKATKALAFIYHHHCGQTRDDGSPYFAHPVKVAQHLATLFLFKEKNTLDVLLAGALLHDILEDTDVTYDEIENEFSAEIAIVVRLLTHPDSMSNEEYYQKIQTNLLASLIKIADRCHNVSTMAGVFTKARLEKYVDETNTLVRPLIRFIRDNHPEVSSQVVCMSYHIKSVINAIKIILPLMKDGTAA